MTISLWRILYVMSASSSTTSTAAAMNHCEVPKDFGYMPHYQHYAAVLEAGGLQLSTSEQRYLISLIRGQTRTTPKTTSQGQRRRSSTHRIIHSAPRRPQPVTATCNENSRLCGLRTTDREEDLLYSLVGSRDLETDRVSDSPAGSPASDCSIKDEQSVDTESGAECPSSSYAAIIIPFSTDDDEQKP